LSVADPGIRRYTYADLAAFPEDRLRREIIDGELIVTPSPVVRHQIASGNIHHYLYLYAAKNGGLALAAPMDVVLDDDNVVEPDLLFVRTDHIAQVGEKYIEGPPDLVVEISSTSTRRLELVRKRELYERHRVAEYWYVDLDADRVEIYMLTGDRYETPRISSRGELLESTQLPGLSIPVDEAVAAESPPPR